MCLLIYALTPLLRDLIKLNEKKSPKCHYNKCLMQQQWPASCETPAFCAAASRRFAVIGRFVATAFDKVSFPNEEWSDIAIWFCRLNCLFGSLIVSLGEEKSKRRSSKELLC